ncbi:MAG: barstar family protein [Treponema sp.]|nr:barstar family protein [Treponema sp.]
MDSSDKGLSLPREDSSTKHYTVDLSQVTDKESLHEQLVQSLPLPEYYGRNLDALYDCLRDAHETWNITFTGCAHAEAVLAGYFLAFKETLEDVQEASDSVHSKFE